MCTCLHDAGVGMDRQPAIRWLVGRASAGGRLRDAAWAPGRRHGSGSQALMRLLRQMESLASLAVLAASEVSRDRLPRCPAQC